MLTKSELNVEKRWMSKQVDKRAEFRQFRAYLGWPSLQEIAATLYLPCLLRHWTIDIESLQNRLLKVCYVPAASAGIQG